MPAKPGSDIDAVPSSPVIPANAGTQCLSGNPATTLGSRIRGSDEVDLR